MRGHIYARANAQGERTWSYRYDGPPKEDGSRQQYSKHGFETKAQAERALRAKLSDIDSGDFVEPSKVTVGEYLNKWLPTHRPNVRASTWASYRNYVTRHLIPRLGGIRLQSLKRSDLQSFYADLTATGLSSRTVRYCHSILRLALNDALKDQLVHKNVAAIAKPPKHVKTEQRFWTGDEAFRFLNQVAEDRLYAAWALALATGARRGEILGLRWKDCDLDSGCITINQTLVTVDNKPQFSTPKTDQGRRTIDLDARTVAILKTHKAAQAQEKLSWGPDYTDSGLVFTMQDGTAIHPDSFSGAFERLARGAGLPRIRFHDLRHSGASLMIAAGINILVVSKRLGHASVAFTLSIYGHLMPEQGAEAAEKLAAVIYGTS